MNSKLWNHMAETHDLYLTESEEADVHSAAFHDCDEERKHAAKEIARLHDEKETHLRIMRRYEEAPKICAENDRLRKAGTDAFNAINKTMETFLAGDMCLHYPTLTESLHQALNGLKRALHQNVSDQTTANENL